VLECPIISRPSAGPTADAQAPTSRPRHTVGVYVATGQPDQCQSLGEKPLPTTYASAAARLRDLQQTLLALQNERDCTSVTSIASSTRAILASHGFTHWRVITPPTTGPDNRWTFGYALPAGTGGTCGSLLTGSYPPSKTILDRSLGLGGGTSSTHDERREGPLSVGAPYVR
jgi:hypothetical protein